MSRWIDADELIKNKKHTADLGGWIGEALYQIKQLAIKYIDSAPSIDICLCGECAYKGEINCPMYYRDRELKPTAFCSYGERSSE